MRELWRRLRWSWESRGEIVAAILVVVVLAAIAFVMEWRDDDGPTLPVAAFWYVGLGLLVIVPAIWALRRWDRNHPNSS